MLSVLDNLFWCPISLTAHLPVVLYALSRVKNRGRHIQLYSALPHYCRHTDRIRKGELKSNFWIWDCGSSKLDFCTSATLSQIQIFSFPVSVPNNQNKDPAKSGYWRFTITVPQHFFLIFHFWNQKWRLGYAVGKEYLLKSCGLLKKCVTADMRTYRCEAIFL